MTSTASLIERRDIRFRSGDADCAAWHFPATSALSGACVVMAHGLGAIKEVGLERFARRFAAAGHQVLAFDYRGFGGSDGWPRQVVDIAGQQDDWRSAVAFARTLPGVNTERIVLWGTSYSGGHVLHLAAERTDVAAAVAQVPMADGLAAARGIAFPQSLRLAAHGLRDELGSRIGCHPHTVAITGEPGELALLTTPGAAAGLEVLNPDRYPWPNEVAARFALRAPFYRPVRHAARIACPLLVVVADADTITPPAAAVRAAELAPGGELVRVAGGHYAVYHGQGFEQAVSAQLAFLDRHLPNTTTPTDGAPTSTLPGREEQ